MRDLACGDTRVYLDIRGAARRLPAVRVREAGEARLAFRTTRSTQSAYAFYVGRRCRSATIKDVAKELRLDWHTVKAQELQTMALQLKRAGKPAPLAIGIDEISIRKGHTYRIVVSDLSGDGHVETVSHGHE